MLAATRLAARALRRSATAAPPGWAAARPALGHVPLLKPAMPTASPELQAARQAMRFASSATAKDVAQMSAMQQLSHYKDIYKKLSKWRLR